MIPHIRKAFNAAFTQEKYEAYCKELFDRYNYVIEFRIAESPVFVPAHLTQRLIDAGDEIIATIMQPDFKELTKGAVPAECVVPNEDEHAQFLALDFAVTQLEDGTLSPQLIELQGFPSLYAFQDFISRTAKKHWNVPDNLPYHFSGLSSEDFINLLGETILNGHSPENVVLLEIEPERQKTKIDFYCTSDYLGIESICLSEVIKEGKSLFYMLNGVKTPIKRIYNRVIFDELLRRTDLKLQYTLTDDVDVEWAGHPAWFFRISKYTLPLLNSQYVPKTWYLNELTVIPADLENYVLKPLFSFAGQGVIFHVKPEDIDNIPAEERHNFILMRKVQYAAVLETPEEPVKVEIRLLFLWPEAQEKPTLATSLIRMSKGEMMGVAFNKQKSWVGGSTAFFEHGA